ncbi:MAG: AAA family ATPase [Vulcanimicrobiota bacterium]
MRSQAPRIPGVELLDELGAGARNLVFRGRRRGREAAIKLPRRRHEPEQTYEEYRREAGLQARVRGAGLPEVYEVGRSGATPFLVSEFVEGVSLAEKLKSGPLSSEQVRRLAMELAQTLGVVHERGLVHRDVKPSNVMLTPEGRARLIDFGLASRSYLQEHGTLTGTFLYAAPEQTGMLCRAVDGRADLYSLGALLFECLTGAPPFKANDAAELIRLHAVAPVPPLSSLCAAPADLVTIVEKLLAKDPDDRFENAWKLLNSLGVLAEVPIESVFLGRDQELARLEKEWGRALEGRGRMGVIAGESGCGKTMLVETFARGCSRHLVLRGKCDPTRTNPFALLLELFSDLPQTPEVARAAGESARLLAGFSPRLAWLEPDGQAPGEVDPAQYYQVLTDFWLALARQPLLVVIDDLQWLDPSSAQILKRVMESLARTRCLLLATHRNPESSEFENLVLCRLAPLTASQTEQLVTELLGAPPEANLIEQVILAAGGNPLATVATVEAALDAGVFVPHWGGWRVESEGLTALELSGDVMELVLRRLDHLAPEQRRVLEAAAVLGLRFESGLLREVTRCAEEELYTVLAEACRLRLLEAHPGGIYRFVHDRVREALSGLDEELRRELHLRAARALADQPANLFARAEHYWSATAGQPDAATAQACEQAASLALERAAADEAYLFFTRAESSRPPGIEVTAAYQQSFGEAC